MQTRTRYEVLPTTAEERQTTGHRWKFTRNSETLATFKTQQKAIDHAKLVAKAAWKGQGSRGELKIKGRDGTIKDSRTYGADPVGTKG